MLEYCSYGCAYFVLENKEPHRASFDKKSPVKKAQSEEREPKKRSRNRKQKDRFQKRERDKGQPANNSKKTRPSAETKKTTKTNNKRHFVIRQKEE